MKKLTIYLLGVACAVALSAGVAYSIVSIVIDIAPGNDSNSINTNAKGVISVAILTTDDFDALTIDADSVLFGPAEAEKKHKKAHVEDVDGDGDLDLVFHFPTQDTGIAPGDTEACLIGQTYDGVPIMGCDSVRTVPPVAEAGPVTEDLSPCVASDVWEFEATVGQTVFIEADTLDAATAADLCFFGDCGAVDFFGDDDFACTFPPPAYACPLNTFVAAASGTCNFEVRTCSSACADPRMANYVLTVELDGTPASLTLTGDDIGAPPQPSCHDLCDVGDPLLPSCDPCAEAICAVDPYCCEVEWDSICVDEIFTVCGAGCIL